MCHLCVSYSKALTQNEVSPSSRFDESMVIACVCVCVSVSVCVRECLRVDTLKRDYAEDTQGNRIDDKNMTFQGVFGANRFSASRELRVKREHTRRQKK